MCSQIANRTQTRALCNNDHQILKKIKRHKDWDVGGMTSLPFQSTSSPTWPSTGLKYQNGATLKESSNAFS